MSMLAWPQVHLTEVDGVPAVWAEVPGPLRAGLIVRVGSADETLVTSGITHLLEHLALFGLGRPGDHANGHVDQTSMHFHCVGDEELVTGFIGAVTRQLADPPTDRIEQERGVLRTELAGRRAGVEDALLSWRYGAQTYGLTGQSQYAVEHVDAERVVAWARRFATRGNAALWLSGPPPPQLRVHLPDGEAMTMPDPHRTIQPQLPAWFSAPDSTGVALHALLPRDYAAPVLAGVLQARLVDQLRVRGAMAYSPQTDYRAVDRDTGRLLAVSDLVDGRQTDAVRLFTTALADLAASQPPTEHEVADWRSLRERDAAEPLAPLGFAASWAWNLLVGHPVDSVEQMVAAMAGVTPDDVRAAAATALGSAVAAIPDGVRLTREPWHEALVSNHPRLTGTAHRGAAGEGVLTAAPEGLTWSSGQHHVTVPVERAVAVLHWRDGRRVLIADDANRIVVEPTMWATGQDVVRFVDRQFPEHLRVDMGERPSSQVPQPPPVVPPPPAGVGARVRSWWHATPVLPVLASLVLVTMGVALVATIHPLPGFALSVLGLRLIWSGRSGRSGR